MGLAVQSRVSLLILHTQAESGAYSRNSSRSPRRSPFICLNRHTPSSQSRVSQVTQLRTDGVHCRESAGTGPVVLKVVPVTCAAILQITMDHLMCATLSPHPLLIEAGEARDSGCKPAHYYPTKKSIIIDGFNVCCCSNVVVVSRIRRIGCQTEKTILHGGQSRSWSANREKKKKGEKVWQRTPSVGENEINVTRPIYMPRRYAGLGPSRVRTWIPSIRRLGQWVSLRKMLRFRVR